MKEQEIIKNKLLNSKNLKEDILSIQSKQLINNLPEFESNIIFNFTNDLNIKREILMKNLFLSMKDELIKKVESLTLIKNELELIKLLNLLIKYINYPEFKNLIFLILIKLNSKIPISIMKCLKK